MKSMTPFQLIVTSAFVALTIIGVGVFAAFGGLGGSQVGAVTIWGTADGQMMNGVLQAMRQQDKNFQDVVYVQKAPGTYETDVVNAIASGSGPDLILVSQENIGAFSDKVLTIPYSAISQSTYVNSYIDEGQLFLTTDGTLALPLTVDPLVMYYNRDTLATAGIAQPPQFWNDFLTLAPKMTAIDGSQNIKRSAVALGEWRNVSHAKAILTSLVMQAGDPLTQRDSQGAMVGVFGSTPPGAPENPAAAALRFYTDFANPAKTSYSWNRSLANSTQAFVAGDTAIYFGFASEYADLARRNPNLRFSAAQLPQLQGSSASLTYGYMTALAIPRNSKNAQGALTIALTLTGKAGITAVATATNLPPVRRDVSFDTSANAIAAVFVQSALIARGWFDPSPAATDGIFQTMIESVTTGKSEPTQAAIEAEQQFNALFKTTQ